MKWNKKTKNILFIAAVVIAGIIFVWKVADSGSTTSQRPAQSTSTPASKTEVSYDGVAGKNALALLKTSHKTETKSYKGLGELVTSIDGTKADTKHFWSFYVNGKQAQVGAGAYTTKTGEKITWKLEEIK